MRIATLAVTMAAAAVVALPTTANAADPVAVPDTAKAFFETPVVVDVLANDTHDEGTTLAITGKTDGTNGAVTCDSAAGTCTYTPDADWSGTDSFTYTVTDGVQGTAPATGTVTVETEAHIAFISLSSTPANLVAVDDPEGDPTGALRNPTHQVNGVVTTTGQVPLEGVDVQLYSRTDTSLPKVAVEGGLVTSDAEGRIVVSGLQPTQKTHYSWESASGKNSQERSVTVTPFLTTNYGNKTFAEGESLTVTGLAGPVAEGQDVVLERKDAVLGWVEVETVQVGVPEEDNSAAFAFTPIAHELSDKYLYRVIVPDTNGRERATSGQTTVRVYQAKVNGIQPANSDEWVAIKNTGKIGINLNNWVLEDNNDTVVLPRRSVGAGGVVRIHTGKGTNNSKNLYLKRADTLWASSGTVTLTDNDEVLLDTYVY